MSCDPFEWTCARCGKTYSNPFFTSYPREFWKDNKKRVGEVLNSILTGGASRPTTEMAIFARLADLIDRPAIKPEPSGRAYWRCPRCGAFNYRSAVTDCCGVIPAHYCANCGAEVVG